MTAATAASSGELNGSAIRKALVGKIVYLSDRGIVLPIKYSRNGTMNGRLKISTAGFAGSTPTRDMGRWWISRDQLCQRWNRWQGGKSYCYKLSRQGPNVVWIRNDGRRGTARIGT
jgi:hypothetical protein